MWSSHKDFFVKGGEDKVYKLKKALKKATRAWYGEIDVYFMKKGFKEARVNPHYMS